MESVKTLMKGMVPLAKEILVEAGSCEPIVMLFADGKACIIDDPVRNDKDKEAMRKKMRKIIAGSCMDAAILVMEIWWVPSTSYNFTKSVSGHQTRKEALFVVGKDAHDHLACFLPFTRSGNRIIFGQEVWKEPEISWFTGCKFSEAPETNVVRSQSQA
jgi:hypothetical protein